jgi:hypothetical protein
VADNFETNAGSGGAVFASDDIAGVHYPYAKVAFGADGAATVVAAAAGLPVAQQTGATFTVVGAAADGAAAAGNPVLVGGFDGTNAQSISVTTGGQVHIHDGGNTISVDDGGGALTVDGTVAVSGTVTVDASGSTIPVSNAGLTELAGAINASAQMDVNIAASGATVPVSHSALTELAAAIDTEVQVDVVGSLPAGDNNIGNVDIASALPAGTNNIGDVDVLSVVPGTGATNLGKAADAVAGATDTGVVPLAIRDDALSTLTPAEGDYAPLRVNSTGALYVTGGGGGTQYNVDDVASATATGTVALVVRKDSAASLAGTDGDISALQVDANGALRVTGGGGGTEYTVDAAAPAAPVGATFVMERDDALSSLTEAEGDWTNPRANANGAMWVAVDGTVAVGSHAVTNAGTFAVQESGAALTALQVIDNPVLVDDAAFTPGTSSVMMAGFQADETSTDSVNEGDAGAARMTLDRKLIVTLQPHTAGGLSIFRSLDIDETEEDVKTSAGVLYSIAAFNRTAAPLYLKFYNATAANVTVGTTTPVLTFVVPANADSDGAGFVLEKTYGWTFDTAISVACTTGVADSDTGAPGANDCVINLGYL